MKYKVARLLSIYGHPAITMLIAASTVSIMNSSKRSPFIHVFISALCAVIVMAYSYLKIKNGDWKHIDASYKAERAELNQFAGLGLLIIATMLLLFNFHHSFVAAVGLSGSIVVIGHLFYKIAKPSLHVAFGVFSAFITWPALWASLGLALLTLGVAWSRLVLARHEKRDLVIGATIGALAGSAFRIAGQFFNA